jgi:hypothetical protein
VIASDDRGIRFFVMLTAAFAQRFITPAVAEVQEEVKQLEARESDMVGRIRSIIGELERLKGDLWPLAFAVP